MTHPMSYETVLDTPDTRVLRDPNAGKHSLSLLSRIFVERGTNEDWKLLHELHYKSSNLGIGPRFMRCALEDGTERGQTIGCMVFTVPKPLDSGRNSVFPYLKPNTNGRDNRLINQTRIRWINNNLILSSRTVLDTMYRGAGIAYRFKNIGYRMMGFRYVESRSSMSRYNPFSVKAGMRFVAPKAASALEDGLRFMGRNFTSPAYDYAAIVNELNAMPEHIRERTLDEMRKWYYKHSSMEKSGENRLNGMSRIDGMETKYLLKQVMQLIFGATIYAVWANPDYQMSPQGVAIGMRKLPPRIPLLAFENQRPDEPLRLDLLPHEYRIDTQDA